METNFKNGSTRNPAFDIMKGIGIILVLVGHIPDSAYISIGPISADRIHWFVQHVFPPFKMPMFFLLAGYFTRPWVYEVGNGLSEFRSFASKKFNRLIIPYLVTFGLLIMWSIIPAICKHDWHMPIRHLLSMIWGGHTFLGDGMFGDYFNGIEIIYAWFILALFWGLIMLFVLSKWPKFILCGGFVISLLACAIFPILDNYVPWSILQGLGGGTIFGNWALVKNSQIATLVLGHLHNLLFY